MGTPAAYDRFDIGWNLAEDRLNPIISLREVSYQYPGIAGPALRDVSLEIPAGQFCALIGANEAGKSTLAYTLSGFIPHFYHGKLNGQVRVDGLDTAQTPLNEMVLHVGLILQDPFNQISGAKFTVREEIAFGLENLGVPRSEMQDRVSKTMDTLGISDISERSPLALSGGQMQRVAIASVLAMNPKILILDEPTSQLDPIGRREVFSAVHSLITQSRMTVVMIEHNLEWIGVYADRVIALSEGKIIADGQPRQVLTDASLPELGIGGTRYTQAARRAREAGHWPEDRRLAVTLDEAVEGFQSFPPE
jgi:energy-coupling factor transport system ATP-binding protein